MLNDEARRLDVLRLYRILDTASEKAFDDLTQLAANICNTPVSLVTLLDEDRQWFKARVGTSLQETPRDIAFCNYAIQSDDVTIVDDMAADERFRENPLVCQAPHLRFYAGAPLIVEDGFRLGTLCVLDTTPHTLSEDQISQLETLRDAVVTQLELRKASLELNAMRRLLAMCSWCSQVHIKDEQGEHWEPAASYVSRVDTVSHTICPSCRNKVESKL